MEQPVVAPAGSPSPTYSPAPPPVTAEKLTVGSYLLGLLGALLGALIGAIPWFIASTFLSIFVGWLGFIVGLASFFGYKLFKGARSVPFAMVSVIVLSVAAICLAEFAGYMYVYWQAWTELAAEEGVVLSAGELFRLSAGTVFEALANPEYTVEMVGNLVIGLAIAVLGIVTVRRHIFAYANEGRPLYSTAESCVPVSVPYNPAADTSLPDGAAGSIPVPVSGVSQPMESVPAVPVPVEAAVSADGAIPAVPPVPAVPAAVPVGAPLEEPKAE